jgi:hypothetical protein
MTIESEWAEVSAVKPLRDDFERRVYVATLESSLSDGATVDRAHIDAMRSVLLWRSIQ